jgi:pilus assembly protein CpaB
MRGGDAEETDTVPVVVATADVARGEFLSAAQLEIRDWPADYVPKNAIRAIEEAENRAVAAPITADEPVLETNLSSASGGGLASLVPRGMRAYTIETRSLAANVAGFVLPGNRVDVLLTLKDNFSRKTGGGSTTTLLQAVEILAVDQQLNSDTSTEILGETSKSVTLLVSPDQATKLDLAQNLGDLSLALRNPEDDARAETSWATLSDIQFFQDGPAQLVASLQGSPRNATPGARDVGGNVESEDPKKSEPEPAATESNPEVFEIRTLRGSHSGRVYVHTE